MKIGLGEKIAAYFNSFNKKNDLPRASFVSYELG